MTRTALPVSSPSLSRRRGVFLHAALFVLGFSIVFIVGWGGAATLLGQALEGISAKP